MLVRRKNLTLIFNEYLYLASGNPQPKILWTSQETQEIISKSNKLYFEAVSPSDTGSYICVASNDAGERYLEISIVVQLPPQECRQKIFFGQNHRNLILRFVDSLNYFGKTPFQPTRSHYLANASLCQKKRHLVKNCEAC